MKEKFVSPGEVAAELAVHKTTVRSWCRAGLVVCEQTPTGQWRVKVDEKGWPVWTVEE